MYNLLRERDTLGLSSLEMDRGQRLDNRAEISRKKNSRKIKARRQEPRLGNV